MVISDTKTDGINQGEKPWNSVSFTVPILIVRIMGSKVLGTSLVMRHTENIVFDSFCAVAVRNVSPSVEIPYFLEPISPRRTLEGFYVALPKAIAFEPRLAFWVSIKIRSYASLM